MSNRIVEPLFFVLQLLLLGLLLLDDVDVLLDGVDVGERLLLRQLALLEQHLQELHHAHLEDGDQGIVFISTNTRTILWEFVLEYERKRFARETRVGELFLETMNDQGRTTLSDFVTTYKHH